MITYYLKEKPKEGRVRLQILDAQGKVLAKRPVSRRGRHPSREWDLRMRVGAEEEPETPAPGQRPTPGEPHSVLQVPRHPTPCA